MHTPEQEEEAAEHEEEQTIGGTANAVLTSPPATPPEKGSRLEKIEQRIAQLEAQKKAILAREKEKTRKERTRRLIQYGAISLKYLNLPDTLEPAEFEQVMQRIVAALGQKSAAPLAQGITPPTTHQQETP